MWLWMQIGLIQAMRDAKILLKDKTKFTNVDKCSNTTPPFGAVRHRTTSCDLAVHLSILQQGCVEHPDTDTAQYQWEKINLFWPPPELCKQSRVTMLSCPQHSSIKTWPKHAVNKREICQQLSLVPAGPPWSSTSIQQQKVWPWTIAATTNCNLLLSTSAVHRCIFEADSNPNVSKLDS